MNLFAKMIRRRPADLLMVVEALSLLAIFRISLAIIPVRRIIRAVTHGRIDEIGGSTILLSDAAQDAARRVQWAVQAAARHAPFEFVCFPQTLAAYVMLRWRGYPSTVVYGVMRSPDQSLLAHTWLEMGGGYVVGGEESVGFAAIERRR